MILKYIVDKFNCMYHEEGERVLLHEAELCAECAKHFLSLYPIKGCNDHEGMEKI